MASAPPADESHRLAPIPLALAGVGSVMPRLPGPVTRLIGRDAELATLVGLLRHGDTRLVTITGPGGVGKTRLALECLHHLADELAGRVAFVSLAAVLDPGRVMADVAIALDVRAGPNQTPLDALVADLGDAPFLLTLDNFEHLLVAAPLVTGLLAACPGLRVLVTSRTRLRLSGEHGLPVPPLTVPDHLPAANRRDTSSKPIDPVADALNFAAVRLFVERARAVNPTFTLTFTNAGAVAEVCRRLDGLPLALELAAARTRVLSPAALLARLENRLHVLTSGPVDHPERLRTLRAAIAWSDDLLTEDERRLFHRLAVFVGGFDLEGAELFCVTDNDAPGNEQVPPSIPRRRESPALDLVATLVDHSLLQQATEIDGEPRFAMLETLRDYALERLAAEGDERAARDAHAAWMLTLAERADAEIAGPEQQTWVVRIESEWSNLRAALDWLTSSGETERALRLGGAINWFWSSAGHFEEGRDRMAALIALPGAGAFPAALAKVLDNAASVANWLGEQDRAQTFYEHALALHRDLGNVGQVAGALRGLGSVALDRNDLDRAEAVLVESLTIGRASGHEWEIAAVVNLLGSVAFARGDYTDAIRCHEEAGAGWEAIGDPVHTAVARVCGGWAALMAGDLDRATKAYRSVTGVEGIEDDEYIAAQCLMGCGGLALVRGEIAAAVRLFAASVAEWDRLGVQQRPAAQLSVDGMVSAARASLGRAAFDAAWAAGLAMARVVAMAEGREVLDGPSTADSSSPFGLTRREREVLSLLVQGRSDREIADALFISRPTASKHVSNILGKLGTPSRTAAVAAAVRDGLTYGA